jgi:hypothetical protein
MGVTVGRPGCGLQGIDILIVAMSRHSDDLALEPPLGKQLPKRGRVGGCRGPLGGSSSPQPRLSLASRRGRSRMTCCGPRALRPPPTDRGARLGSLASVARFPPFAGRLPPFARPLDEPRLAGRLTS